MTKNPRIETGYQRFMFDEEFWAIHAYLMKKKSPSLKMCIRNLMITGVSNGDGIALRRQNYSKNFELLTFIRLKTKKVYQVSIPPFFTQELAKYYEKYKHRMTDDHLFFANWGNQSKSAHLQTGTIACFFRDLRRDLGFTHSYYTCVDGKKLYRISPHTLRHFAAGKIYEVSGKDVVKVKEFLNHTKLDTTMKYIKGFKRASEQEDMMNIAFAGV